MWLTIATTVHLILVTPIWAILDCASNESLDGSRKRRWITVIILTWTFGALLYGCNATTNRRLTKNWRALLIWGILILPGWHRIRIWAGFDFFSFELKNQAPNSYTNVVLRTPGVKEEISDAPAGSDGYFSMLTLDPTFYLSIEFTMPDGQKRLQRFFFLIPWRHWMDFATGNQRIHLEFKDPGQVVITLDEPTRK